MLQPDRRLTDVAVVVPLPDDPPRADDAMLSELLELSKNPLEADAGRGTGEGDSEGVDRLLLRPTKLLLPLAPPPILNTLPETDVEVVNEIPPSKVSG